MCDKTCLSLLITLVNSDISRLLRLLTVRYKSILLLIAVAFEIYRRVKYERKKQTNLI